MALLAAGILLGAGPTAAFGEEAAVDFKQNCSSCHTIGGGRVTGPDLKDVASRQDRGWLARFITDPKAALEGGDPYALALRDEARGAVMPNLPGMTPDRASALLDLIEAESKKERSQFAGVQMSDRPFTPADVAAGADLFRGEQPQKNGGAACISCHTVGSLGGLGGGTLGPDLTEVFERLQGRKGLATWLSAPATPTMQATFRDHPLEPEEILPLVAFLQDEATRPPGRSAPYTLLFLLLGLTGAAGVLITFEAIWSNRFRAVRRPLVSGADEGRLP